MNIHDFAMDETLEVNGVWQMIGDAEVLVARANNTAYVNLLRKVMAPYLSNSAFENLTTQQRLEIDAKIMAQTILLDWKNLTDDQAKVVPYSVEKAVEWLMAYAEFRKLIARISEDTALYRDKIVTGLKADIKKP